jgi:hypothetical protein
MRRVAVRREAVRRRAAQPGGVAGPTFRYGARGEAQRRGDMEERPIPVKVFEELVRHVVRWIEVNRPHDADREQTTQWVLSAAFSTVAVAGAACASIGALGGEITEEQFVSIAREAYRRAHQNVAGAGAGAGAMA